MSTLPSFLLHVSAAMSTVILAIAAWVYWLRQPEQAQTVAWRVFSFLRRLFGIARMAILAPLMVVATITGWLTLSLCAVRGKTIPSNIKIF